MKGNFSNNNIFIESLRKGDSKAYTYLVETYHHRLCVYAFGLIHDHDIAEDIVQNVFVRIWRKREKLKENFSIQSFLYKSVYNEFIDLYRKQKMVFPLEKKYIEALTSIVEDDDPHSLERLIRLVQKEIQNLPPKCKDIFLLSKEEGLSNIEIANYKNVSIKTVEAHITKAYEILKEKIGNKAEGILFILFGAKKRFDI